MHDINNLFLGKKDGSFTVVYHYTVEINYIILELVYGIHEWYMCYS
jgi:hypothetical protein